MLHRGLRPRLILAAVGLALPASNVVALIAAVMLVVAIELQVRAAEEPYLRQVHGDNYRHYAARVGRLVSLVSRLRITGGALPGVVEEALEVGDEARGLLEDQGV